MERSYTGAAPPMTIRAGDGLELRPVTLSHAAALYAAIDRNRARLREWLPWIHAAYGFDDLTAFLNDRVLENAARTSFTTCIWAGDELCGSIALHLIDMRNRSTSIGYWLDAAYEGRGIMTRVCRAMITEAFRSYDLHRIEIRCASGNAKSGGIPARLGFTYEGTLREAEWLHDHWVDLRVFSMIETGWKP
jgi:ribosomal-protein-serine acetyltransferase